MPTKKIKTLDLKVIKSEKPIEEQKNNNKIIKIFLIFISLLLAFSTAGLTFLYFKEKNKINDSTFVATEEIRIIKEKLSKHYLLSRDEDPTIATIVDIDTLKEQNPTFYEKAQNNDKVIIYSDKAFIFRIEEDIIVNVAPVIKQPIQNNDMDSLIIDLRNGTQDENYLDEVAVGIMTNLGENFIVESTSNALSDDFTQVIIYDLSDGTKSNLVNILAEELKATIEKNLPEGEPLSNADVVVILGK